MDAKYPAITQLDCKDSEQTADMQAYHGLCFSICLKSQYVMALPHVTVFVFSAFMLKYICKYN